ncbi:MAG: toll/interleukin-1 receptor domain-containing protein [Phormidesmis sp. CAN_BIN44]|nr:toll/interleukin-1 receptor domain-containing protein [Phormidesmis sp. CAN_BIN44]
MSENRQFDVFLCHNSNNKTEVKEVGYKLKELGLVPWLDEWELIPGRSGRRLLEAQIEQVSSVAVFVGKNGIGPWQDEEISAFLYQVKERNCPIIPVLLQNAPEKPNLPPFLVDRVWVDFCQNQPDPIEQLFWGITEYRPNEYLRNKLATLLKQKNDLEIEIQDVQQKLNNVDSLRDSPDPNLQILLDWLCLLEKGKIEEYANKILKRFPELEEEVIKEKNLDEFHLEIVYYISCVRLSIERNNEIFIDEPRLSPTLADHAIYQFACFDVYKDMFGFIKDRVPERVELAIRNKLGANIDTLLKRLLV